MDFHKDSTEFGRAFNARFLGHALMWCQKTDTCPGGAYLDGMPIELTFRGTAGLNVAQIGPRWLDKIDAELKGCLRINTSSQVLSFLSIEFERAHPGHIVTFESTEDGYYYPLIDGIRVRTPWPDTSLEPLCSMSFPVSVLTHFNTELEYRKKCAKELGESADLHKTIMGVVVPVEHGDPLPPEEHAAAGEGPGWVMAWMNTKEQKDEGRD